MDTSQCNSNVNNGLLHYDEKVMCKAMIRWEIKTIKNQLNNEDSDLQFMEKVNVAVQMFYLYK